MLKPKIVITWVDSECINIKEHGVWSNSDIISVIVYSLTRIIFGRFKCKKTALEVVTTISCALEKEINRLYKEREGNK